MNKPHKSVLYVGRVGEGVRIGPHFMTPGLGAVVKAAIAHIFHRKFTFNMWLEIDIPHRKARKIISNILLIFRKRDLYQCGIAFLARRIAERMNTSSSTSIDSFSDEYCLVFIDNLRHTTK